VADVSELCCTPPRHGRVSPEKTEAKAIVRHRAQLTVARNAIDRDELRRFLDMLGLLSDQEEES